MTVAARVIAEHKSEMEQRKAELSGQLMFDAEKAAEEREAND